MPGRSFGMRKVLVGVVMVLAFVVNPLFACDVFTSFSYGEPEMRAAVEGKWAVTLTPPNGAPSKTITFTIKQAATAKQSSREHGLIRSAAACGHRTFVKSAEACIDETEMPLTIVALGDDAPVLTGTFRVFGTTFKQGSLDLRIDNVIGIDATISSSGQVLSVDAGFAVKLARVK